jgi:antirestriction protein ArdC
MSRTSTVDRRDRVAELHDQLIAGVDSLTSSEDWRRMLNTAARFHRYSANNVMLILCQRPESTRVAGYRAWQSMGRQVRKGERGIAILAPCVYRRELTDQAGDPTGETVKRLAGFKVEHVFDISQTDGKPIADVRPELLDGDGPAGAWEGLARQVKAAGFELERAIPAMPGANGCTDYAARVVTVRADVTDAQAVKTLAHELAHVRLHEGGAYRFGCRGRVEVEAESTAYVVCQALGMATDGYSLPYVASWAAGNAETVRETADRVVGAARAILAGLTATEQSEGVAA